jgi:hypothetical protein
MRFGLVVFVVAYATSQWIGLMGLLGLELPGTVALGAASHFALMPGYLVVSSLGDATLERTGLSPRMLTLFLLAAVPIINLGAWLLLRATIRRIVAFARAAKSR